MKTLIIYDETGYILFQGSGSVREPVGIPFIWVEVPQGKYAESVELTDKENPVPVFKDFPISEETKKVLLLEQKVNDLTVALANAIGA